MRTPRAAAAVTLLGAAALPLSAPAATASVGQDATSFGFSVTPSTVAPGGRVTLNVTGCPTSTYATSAVFNPVTIPRDGSAAAIVDRDASPGASYQVTFDCKGEKGRSELTVAGPATLPPTISSTVAPTVSPTGAVKGGVGGGSRGPEAWEIAGGLALVTAAFGGTVYVVRRRSGRRQP
ncbi:hypothetical protein [Streptomyces sannanensis]